MIVYLIHLEKPVNPDRPAQHYLGWTTNLSNRIEQHRTNQGAKILKAANQRNIKWEVVATWNCGRGGEVQFKRRRNHKRYCPKCQQKNS